MRSVTLDEVQTNLSEIIESAQKERVLFTQKGKPRALLIGLEFYDEEDLQLASSPDFWRMIEERRLGASISLAALKKRLNLSGAIRPERKSGGRKPKGGRKSSS